jgi:general secretion pathway protein J
MARLATRRARARRLGMSLIEVMISVVILAIISTLIYSGFVQTSRNKTRVEGQTDRALEVTGALERMVRELQSAYVSAQINPSPSLQVVRTAFLGTDRGSRDRIDFTSFSHQRLYRDAKESDQNELSYFIARDPDASDRRVLVRREQARIDDDPLKGGTLQVVLHDVDTLELEYLDPITNEWVRTWDTVQGTGQPNRLPAQVKITLGVVSIDGRRRTQKIGTRVSLPIRYGLNHAIYTP